MNNNELRDLALSILRVNTEEEVINILSDAGYWDNADAWRDYGDTEGNYSIIGTQQSRAEAALVEKVVNSVDARLMNECYVRGIDPTSEKAPRSIREAVSRFFEGQELLGETGGTLRYWGQPKQLEQSRFITLAVTGPIPTAKKGQPSLTITDCGEGQSPARMPDTFLSLDKNNKLRIAFVQGKYNMGGTGALRFSGRQGMQFILTKRNPAIRSGDPEDTTSDRWGFTVVRRVRPQKGAGQVRNSVYKYLAPVGSNEAPARGEVVSFVADELDLLPDKNDAYALPSSFGSVVKLYEYQMKGFRSHALMKSGLLNRLGILLPGIALPVRIHECRAFRGEKKRSFENTLVGFSARLGENRSGNLEDGFPTSVPLRVMGEEMTAEIYAFKGDRADTYRTTEGIIFTVNGQTHGHMGKVFFARPRVKMGRVAKSLLVVVECSKLSVEAREDLFMNSRDQLSNGELRKAIESELEELIGRHPGLRGLQNRRKAEEIEDRLKDSRPLEEVLNSILKSSPSLSNLFLLGQRLGAPHRTDGHVGNNGTGTDSAFKGRMYPTYFRFHKKPDEHRLERTADLGRRIRVKFETDVENDYFARHLVPGHYEVDVLEGEIENAQLDHSLTLHDGIANWSINLPEDELEVGDQLTIQCTVNDDTLFEPLVNVMTVTVSSMSEKKDGNGKHPREGRTDTEDSRKGRKKGEKSGNDLTGGIAMPDVIEVLRGSAYWQEHDFDDHTGCKVIEDPVDDDPDGASKLTFYVNVDNLFLRTDMKGRNADAALKKAKFVYGNVLVGLALLHDSKTAANSFSDTDNGVEVDVTDVVAKTTRALSPFLIPMIDNLGALTSDDVFGLSEIGDEE